MYSSAGFLGCISGGLLRPVRLSCSAHTWLTDLLTALGLHRKRSTRRGDHQPAVKEGKVSGRWRQALEKVCVQQSGTLLPPPPTLSKGMASASRPITMTQLCDVRMQHVPAARSLIFIRDTTHTVKRLINSPL